MELKSQYPRLPIRVLASLIDEGVLELFTCGIALGLLAISRYYLGSVSGYSIPYAAQPLGSSFERLIDSIDPFRLQMLLLLIRILLSMVYFVGLAGKYGGTLGKRIFRIQVVSSKNAAASEYLPLSKRQLGVRWLGYGLSYCVPICGGYLLTLFHSQKCGLHDLMAGTVCVKAEKFF
jgi:uncharacterized RDD family membrane protein YckC